MRAEPATEGSWFSALLHGDIGNKGPSLRRQDVGNIMRELATMLAAGQDLDRALRYLHETAPHARVRTVVGRAARRRARWQSAVGGARPLSARLHAPARRPGAGRRSERQAGADTGATGGVAGASAGACVLHHVGADLSRPAAGGGGRIHSAAVDTGAAAIRADVRAERREAARLDAIPDRCGRRGVQLWPAWVAGGWFCWCLWAAPCCVSPARAGSPIACCFICRSSAVCCARCWLPASPACSARCW